MLEPTDRVIAKLIMRAWLDSEEKNNTTADDFARKFTDAIFPAIQTNQAFAFPLIQLFSEVIDEVIAEKLGTASPNAKPYPTSQPQPWIEVVASEEEGQH